MASTRMSEPGVSVASTGPPATVSRRTSAASEAAANLRNGARRDADARPRSSRAAMRTRSITLIQPNSLSRLRPSGERVSIHKVLWSPFRISHEGVAAIGRRRRNSISGAFSGRTGSRRELPHGINPGASRGQDGS